jgi:hypothetical protein
MSEELRLTLPGESSGEWNVIARNRRVLKDWEDLLARAPESTKDCYRRLAAKPLERLQGRVFPLKGKKYPHAWEYEVTSGDRVFYVPDATSKTVSVYYVGKHVTPAPFPPK